MGGWDGRPGWCGLARWIGLGLASLLQACSLFGQSDLALAACEVASDCYPLTAIDSNGPLACFACEAGTCVARPAMFETPRMLDLGSEGPLEVTIWQPTGGDLVLVGKPPGRPLDRLQGWVHPLTGEVGGAQPLQYGSAAPGQRCLYDAEDEVGQVCKIVQHAMAPLTGHVLGAGIDVLKTEAGRVRVGIAPAATPLTYRVDDVPTAIRTGLRSPAGDAWQPAVATLCQRQRCQQALVTWVGSDPDCETPCRETPAVYGLPLAVALGEPDAPDAEPTLMLPSADAAVPRVLARGLSANPTSVAPALVSLADADAPGYLLAVAEEGGVSLHPLGVTAEASGEPVSIPVEQVRELVLTAAAAAPDGLARNLLLTVRAGADAGGRLLVYSVRAGGGAAGAASRVGVTHTAAVTLAETGVRPGVAAAYTTAGSESGHWSIAWRADDGLHAAGLRPAASADGAVVVVASGRVPGSTASAFVYRAPDWPFGYARLVSDPGGISLQTLHCH